MATHGRPYQASRLRQSTRYPPLTIGIHSSTAGHSRKKVVGYFLGEIPSRKNLKEWIYLFGKIGHFSWRHRVGKPEGWQACEFYHLMRLDKHIYVSKKQL
jgi:hypothetical protein